jgi:dihydroxyacetone kinase
MKKFINRPEDVVEEMLQGLCLLHPGLARLSGHKVVVRANAEQIRDRQVALLSGGGSGHEPAHTGYVGAGMLSAAVLGEIFTSPSSDSVFAAIKAVAGTPGALLVVKNYTGDSLNFGVAAEMARADGIPIEIVIVDDDVALKATNPAVGARGLAGTVFIHKLVGAAAAEGKSLVEVAKIGRDAVRSLATMGVSFSAGTSPVVGRPSFELGEDEMELGLGIHGEPGITRCRIQEADELTETLLKEILKRGSFGNARRVAVMVNNLGATTEMELAVVARHVVPFLEGNGFTVERIYAGTFLSSLDMAGISITLLGVNDEWLRLLDASTLAPAWPSGLRGRPLRIEHPSQEVVSAKPSIRPGVQSEAGRRVRRAIESACTALINAEPELTELDRITGDGDLGASMERAAKAVMVAMDSYPLEDVPETLIALGHTLRRELGGSSGPLYGLLFLRCGVALKEFDQIGVAQWAKALDQGCLGIEELGGAKPGDRTMLDALDPFTKSLAIVDDMITQRLLMVTVEDAERGVEATARMKPRFGRSSYLGDRVLGYPDPGAKAVAIWLRAVCESLASELPL